MSLRGPSSAAGLLALLVGAGLLSGCKEEEALSEEDQRLIAKLQATTATPPAGAIPRAPTDPNAQLALRATTEASEQRLPLPEGTATQHVGPVAVRLQSLTRTHQVAAGKVRLTSEEPFLRVALLVQNVGSAPVTLPLERASVKGSDGTLHPLARDAQRVAGTRELAPVLAPQVREEPVLYFTLPEAALGPGAVLLLRGPGDEEVQLPLR